jgi:hypothetical protein
MLHFVYNKIIVHLKITMIFEETFSLGMQLVNPQSWIAARPEQIVLDKVVMAKNKTSDLTYRWSQLLKETQSSEDMWNQTLRLWAQITTSAGNTARYWQETEKCILASVHNQSEITKKVEEAFAMVGNAAKLIAKAWNIFYSKKSTAEDVYKMTSAMSDVEQVMGTIERDVVNTVGEMVCSALTMVSKRTTVGSQIQIGKRQKSLLGS